jgi:hypothetical protein
VALKNAVRPWLQRKEGDFGRAGIHAVAQRLKENFGADGDHIEIEVRLQQIVLTFYDISKCVTSK